MDEIGDDRHTMNRGAETRTHTRVLTSATARDREGENRLHERVGRVREHPGGEVSQGGDACGTCERGSDPGKMIHEGVECGHTMRRQAGANVVTESPLVQARVVV